jgi:hypothetical protein
MNETQQARCNQIADFLQRRTDLVPQARTMSWRLTGSPITPEQLAHNLLSDAEGRSLQLGTWLGSTDGEIISHAVAMVIPPMYQPEYNLLVRALTLAAKRQREEGQEQAGRLSLAIAGAALFVLVVAMFSN